MAHTPKRLLGSIALAALAAGLLVGPASPVGVGVAAAAAPTTLTFLDINDFHGRIDTNTVKFAGTIEQQRAAAPGGADSVLLLAAGDNVGASLFASASAQDQPTIDVLNALELDASAVGNHEFDQGFADLRDRIIGVGPNADWDYLAANVYNDPVANTVPAPLHEYALYTLNAGQADEVVVGVIGAVTVETPTLVSPAGVSGLRFGDPVAAVNRVAAQLTDGNGANGEADVIIAEYHEGAPDSLIPPATTPTFETEVAKSPTFAAIALDTSAAVDVIFTGHTHQQYAFEGPVPGNPSQKRPILQTGSYGANVGKVTLTVDDAVAGDPVISYTLTNVARTTTADSTLIADYSRVATVNGIVTAALAAAATIGNVAVGSVNADVTTAFSGGSYVNGKYTGGVRDDRAKESTLSDLIADSLVSSLSSPARGGATIGVVNPGGVRAELLRSPDTVVTYAEANSVLPFVNNLNTITLTGAQFKTMLEQQWQRDAQGNVPSRAYLQLGLSKNVTYTFDASLPEGSRITSITIDGQPIDPAGQYRIGSFSFLFDGGDNFRIFLQGTNRTDSGLVDRDAWIDFIKATSPLTPDFARQAVSVSNLPTAVVPGQALNLGVSSLDLTSLGSPANTTLQVAIGGVSAGSVPVANGAATVNLVVPGGVPTGKQDLVLTAQPSGTKVTVRVNVAPTLQTVTPTRLFDTRAGESPSAARTVPKARIGGTTELTVKATDIAGVVPATGVGAVSLNVTVVNPSVDGFLTVYDCGTRNLVASLNYSAGAIVANAVIAPVSAAGNICVFSSSSTDVLADLTGWFATGSSFTAITPNRVLDTRAGESPGALVTVPKAEIGGTTELSVKIAGLATSTTPPVVLVPTTGVGAVSLNLTVVHPAVAGFVTVYDCGTRKLVSNLNYLAGETASSAAIAPVSADGRICFFSSASTDLVVDINGWFATGTSFTASGPNRVFDTRAGESPAALRTVAKTQVGNGYVLEVKVSSLTGVTPASGVGAVSLGVTATRSTVAGFVTVFDCGTQPPTSNLNFIAGQTVSNAVIARVSASGTVCFASSAPVDLVADINGWFAG